MSLRNVKQRRRHSVVWFVLFCLVAPFDNFVSHHLSSSVEVHIKLNLFSRSSLSPSSKCVTTLSRPSSHGVSCYIMSVVERYTNNPVRNFASDVTGKKVWYQSRRARCYLKNFSSFTHVKIFFSAGILLLSLGIRA